MSRSAGPRSSRLLRGGLVAALTVGALAVMPSAHAASFLVGTMPELQTALANCAAPPNTVVLTADLTGTSTTLTVNCDTTIDLAGHDVAVQNIVVSTGKSLEVTDTTPVAPGPDPNADAGTLTANASAVYDSAGIQTTGATLTTSGTAKIVATGGTYGSGIGGARNAGGPGGAGGTTITNDTSAITATGGLYGAGIGGGNGPVVGGVGGTVTTNDSSSITAIGGPGAGGIGGGSGQFTGGAGGTTTANDSSSITATSAGEGGAGIGGGYGDITEGGSGGTTTSNDSSSISATGGDFAAGIGGGASFTAGGDGGTTTSTGGSTITATGGSGFRGSTGGAGIGGGASFSSGGAGGAGGSTTIEGASTIVAAASDGGSAVGVGDPAAPAPGTFLTVTSGTLQLGSDLKVPDAAGAPEVSIGADGVIERRTSPASTAAITGSGTIANGGAITLPTAAVAPTLVTDRHHGVSFDTQGGSAAPSPVTVYADTFTHGDRTLPPDPTKPGYQFLSWNTAANGSGTTVTPATALPGTSNDGNAAPLTLYAIYSQPSANLDDLQHALATCTGTPAAPYQVALTADLTGTATELTVSCDAVVDLAGHDLTVRNIIVTTGKDLEVTDTTPVAPGPDPNADAGTLTADASAITDKAGIQTTGASFSTSGTAHVVATGATFGAGIGGAYDFDGGTVTSADTSTVTATGGDGGSGIGGGRYGTGGTVVTHDSASVVAQGGIGGAGIGGGAGLPPDPGTGGTTTTNDSSTITATGGNSGAGIGGGYRSSGGTTTSNDDSAITATGGLSAAGIGGGFQGSGGHTTIASGSTVVASAVSAGVASAVGVGEGGTAAFGTFLTVDGTLRLGSDLLVPVAAGPPEVTIGADGLIARRTSPASTAAINGDGSVANGGAITLPTTAVVPTPVTDRHYLVSFDTAGGSPDPADVTVYADTFTHGDRTFPPDPTRSGYVFTGWNTAADGSGDPITATTALPGSSSDGNAHPVTLHAQWLDPSSDLTGLKAALASCTGTPAAPFEVSLSADLADAAAELTVNCDAVIDLHTHDLTVRSVVVTSTKSLEVTDTTPVAPGPDPNADAGTLTADASAVSNQAGIQTTGASLSTSGTAQVVATGGSFGAGIGGDVGEAGGTTTTEDTSTITATGGNRGAGIGGGAVGGNGGSTTSNDTSSITATGGTWAAGIGGGHAGAGGITTSNGSSAITATGGPRGSGIGGGGLGAGGTTTSNDASSITAAGGGDGASGIGGGDHGGGGTTTSNDTSTITATGSDFGAGIGGGAAGAGGATSSHDTSAITATGGQNAAGIGGGQFGGGGTTTVDVGSSITATAGASDASAVGVGSGGTAGFGTFLTVDGTLRLGSDLLVPDAAGPPEVTIGAGGLIARRTSPASTATITGGGTIMNGGAITLPTAAVAPTLVKDHHHLVSFDAQGGSPTPTDVTVYADTFAHGDRVLPAASRPGYVFEGWATTPSGGTPVTATTVLPGTSGDGAAVPVTLYAHWRYLTPDIAGLEPTITGTAQVGQTLHADPGPVWPPSAHLTYTWNADDTPLPDSDQADLTLEPDLEGAVITVTITATAPGYLSTTATSDPVGPVAPADPGAVSVVTPPTITGHRWYDATLSTTTGTWTGSPTTFTYQWLRDDTPIDGAVDPTYTTTLADIGHVISVQVTAAQSPTNTGQVTVEAGTITTAPLTWASPQTLKIKGKPQPGKTLRANLTKTALLTGTDPDATQATYQWLRDGTTIKKATKPTYQVKNKDKGHRIVLTVTLTKTGHTPLTLTTKAVRIKK